MAFTRKIQAFLFLMLFPASWRITMFDAMELWSRRLPKQSERIDALGFRHIVEAFRGRNLNEVLDRFMLEGCYLFLASSIIDFGKVAHILANSLQDFWMVRVCKEVVVVGAQIFAFAQHKSK